ncbi:glycosyltransferase family 2 protein [Pseudoxanthomonas daejeonensis]|uniref:glycosyltransferase family 2 protein n=1 Tax=Pseudoxanthomonas daejeonensis TaxID=266062 RepID=UPI001F5441CB|nr:glycosyltransferase family 2 protein [Pseudoxanthomonas daejeonensis]UNK56464.1 glycosyltransferase family 2 protein [Pseudoxanthomonas daejeonensis]
MSTVTLAFPSAGTETLAASIIIPVYNNLACTLDCLRSIVASGDEASCEVIVVDDASTDATRETLEGVPGLRYERNDVNSGFIRTCNTGAALARGRFLVLLNNDTVVQPGWLDSLLKTFHDYPDTGLAGSRLLYPDGLLQEAGCVIFADGRAGNYGRLDAALDPRYSCVRETDYCSGASVAIPAELFSRLGGFDERYLPAYYEDADLAMRVRQAGFRVRYQPHSWVVHLEGVSSGVSEEGGVKAYQRSNRFKFAEHWAQALREFPPWGVSRDLAVKRGGRLLMVAAMGDQRTLQRLDEIRAEVAAGWSVSLFVEHGEFDAPTARRLQAEGIELWQGFWSAFPRGWMRRHSGRFDGVVLLDAALSGRYGRWVSRYGAGIPVSIADAG